MHQQKKELYFFINSLAGGGAEAVLIRLLPFLKPKKVFLLEKDIKYPVSQKNIEFLSSFRAKTNNILRTFFIPFYVLNLSKKIKKNSAIISFLERANFVNIITKFFLTHKVIISVHIEQFEEHKGIKKINLLLDKFLYPKADLIVAVSKGIKDGLIKIGIPEEKIKVIHNPFNIEEIQKKSKDQVEEVFKKNPFIINVGRLTKQKGQWHLLRIFKELKKTFPELKLLILGEGELKNDLVNLSEDLELKTYVWDRNALEEKYDVYFLGFQDNPFKYLSKAEIFILSSLWEGFGNVLIEAMACGTTVISSDCKSGPREILAPDTDFKKQTENPEFAKYGIIMPVLEEKFLFAKESLTQEERVWLGAIEQVLKDDILRAKLKSQSRQRAMDFNIINIAKQWKEILKI